METPLYAVTCRARIGNATQILTLPGWYKTEAAAVAAGVTAWGEQSRSKIRLLTNERIGVE
jgi:hypothetical protein